MTSYKSKFLADCLNGIFIRGGFDLEMDLSGSLLENWKEFN
jgi:hypothetical protein